MSPTEEEAVGPYRGATAVQIPCWGKELSKGTLSLRKKTHSKPQQVAPPARQVVPEFRPGNRLQVLPNRMEVPPHCLSPAPSKPTPRHPGPAASQAPRDSFTKERLQTLLSRHASPKPRFPGATGRPGSSVPPCPGLTAESSAPAQAEAHGQERLPPHLASGCGHESFGAKRKKKRG